MGWSLREQGWLCMMVVGCFNACTSAPVLSARDAADANDTGQTLGAKSESERALLRELPSLPSGSSRRIGDSSVVASLPYAAASGRTCRSLAITPAGAGKTRRQLACTDGNDWFFVPDVFGAGMAVKGVASEIVAILTENEDEESPRTG